MMTLITIVHNDLFKLIPLIYEYKEKINKHILVTDNNQTDIALAENLQKSIENLNKKYNLKTNTELFYIDENSKKDIVYLKSLFEKETDELVLNAAGADTVLCVLLSDIVLKCNGKVFAYDYAANDYNIISKNAFENRVIKNNLSLDDCFILLGEKILEKGDMETIFNQVECLYDLFKDIPKMFKIRQAFINDRRIKFVNHYKCFQSLDIHENIVSHFGVLFERYLFLLLLRYDFDDIVLTAKIRFDESEKLYEYVDNEFDILVIKNNHIGLIEAKIGSNLNPISVVYKSDALMDYFGSESRGLIINLQNNISTVSGKKQKSFGENLIYRAKTKRIGIYSDVKLSEERMTFYVKTFFSAYPRMFMIGDVKNESETIRKFLKLIGVKYIDVAVKCQNKLGCLKKYFSDAFHFYFLGIEIDSDLPVRFSIVEKKGTFLNSVCEILKLPYEKIKKMV
jgi:hypothetical protein